MFKLVVNQASASPAAGHSGFPAVRITESRGSSRACGGSGRLAPSDEVIARSALAGPRSQPLRNADNAWFSHLDGCEPVGGSECTSWMSED